MVPRPFLFLCYAWRGELGGRLSVTFGLGFEKRAAEIERRGQEQQIGDEQV
jgi:hypothetical protein